MFRNREIRQAAIWFVGMMLVLTIVGFTICPAAGILELVTAFAAGTLFYVFTRIRYRNIAELSEQIDMVLHNAWQMDIGEAQEGELSILRSEIVKMTLRIREQNEALRKEKKHLADSLADISHQLRTPLTSVNIILSLVEKSPDKKEQKALLREAGELFAQMDFLLESLLKLSRLDAGIVVFQKERVNIGALVAASLRPFLIALELHDIQIETEIPEGAEMTGDFKWLSEALQNIMKNCMESVKDQGRIRISCQDNPIFTQITIQDDGEGFVQEDLPHLFERFYRGKDADAAGYGIGLALCKTIIMRQGGTVTARNHQNGGAVFSIRFEK